MLLVQVGNCRRESGWPIICIAPVPVEVAGVAAIDVHGCVALGDAPFDYMYANRIYYVCIACLEEAGQGARSINCIDDEQMKTIDGPNSERSRLPSAAALCGGGGYYVIFVCCAGDKF